jgi:hypothetical protein
MAHGQLLRILAADVMCGARASGWHPRTPPRHILPEEDTAFPAGGADAERGRPCLLRQFALTILE